MKDRRSLSVAWWIVIFACVAAVPAYAEYTVTGKFQYEDREFDLNGFTGVVKPRPIRFADVRIRVGTNQLAIGATREDGSFSIVVNDTTAQSITAVCLTSTSQTPNLLLDVRVANPDSSFGLFYSVASAPAAATGSGTVDFGTTIAPYTNDAGKAFNIFDVGIDSEQFVASSWANGGYPAEKLTIIWSLTHPRSGSYYSESGSNKYIFIGGISAYDDTIIAHEFGHYIDDMFSKSDSPGGSHYLGDDNQDMRLSWGEGLATFLGSSARLFRGYPRPDIYVNTNGTSLSWSYEIETLTATGTVIGNRTGSTNEIAVTAALWDIVDGADTQDNSPGTDDDPLQRPFSDVWKSLTVYMPTVTQPGITVETFWDGWFAPAVSNGALAGMQTIFSAVNGIEFIADSAEPDNSATVARALQVPRLPPLASGPKIVINEVDLGGVDSVELYNAGDEEADLTSWSVEGSAVGSASATFVLPPIKVPPGAFLILSEATGVNTSYILYFSTNISWANGLGGACVLKDYSGVAMDFVRWGNSTEAVPVGTAFNGTNPASPPTGKNLGRNFSGADTNTADDWTSQSGTLGTFNISGSEVHHTFYPAGDTDFASFEAVAGNHYLIETMGLFNGGDTIIDLVDANGTSALESNDDFGVAKASRLAWTAPTSGKFYVRVRRFDGVTNYARYGSYSLRVLESTNPLTLAIPGTLTVSQSGEGRFLTLTDAVIAATNGDTIQLLDNATYYETPNISGKSIAIQSAPGKRPIIDGRGKSAAGTISINAKTTRLDGLTVLAGWRGIRVTGGNAIITNSVISGASNPSGSSDGISATGSGSNATIINSTIVNNARLGVGAFSGATVRVVNSIFQNNGTEDFGADTVSQNPNVSNSLLGKTGLDLSNGNILGDPQFVDAANGNYRLKSTSPAIDLGNPNDPDLPPTDADGIPRSQPGKAGSSAIPDAGAYEYLPAGVLTSAAIFPQIAAGGANPVYRTSIVGMNTGALSATVQLSLTKSNAEPFPIRVLNADSFAPSAAPAGVIEAAVSNPLFDTFNFSIPPLGTRRLEAGSGTAITSGYARFLSNVPVNGTALFKTMQGTTVISEAGVGLSKPARKFTVYIDYLGDAISGYAVANSGTLPATLTLVLRDRNGSNKAADTMTLNPGEHIAQFPHQRPAFASIAAAGFEGSIEFTSDQEVAAVALRYDNSDYNVFSTIPILADQVSQTLYFPQVADGGTYRTNFILVNPSSVPVSAKMEFYGSDGWPMSLPVGGSLKSSVELSLGAGGVSRLVTDGTSAGVKVGWVRVTAPTAIGGAAIFQTVAEGRILSEAGVASSPLAPHFSAYMESLGPAQSGLAICNPNSGAATVTLKLRDASGNQVAAKSFELKPQEHVAKFFTEKTWFGADYAEFEGSLEVIATAPVSAVALRYDNQDSNVFATLPVIVIP